MVAEHRAPGEPTEDGPTLMWRRGDSWEVTQGTREEPPSSATQARIKGVVLTSRRDGVRAKYGMQGWRRLVESLGPESQRVLRNPIRATGWYPLALNEELDWAICNTLEGGDRTVFRRLGAHSAEVLMAVTYAAAVAKQSPTAFLRGVILQAPRYFDGLRAAVDEPAAGHLILRLSGIVSNEPNCESNLGFFVRGIELCGGRDVSGSELECTVKGAGSDIYEFRFAR